MTLIYELKLEILTWYLHIKMNFLFPCFQKLVHYTQTDQLTNVNENITTLHSWIEKVTNFCYKMAHAKLSR